MDEKQISNSKIESVNEVVDNVDNSIKTSTNENNSTGCADSESNIVAPKDLNNMSTKSNSTNKLNSEELLKKSKEWIDNSITGDVVKESSSDLQNIITSVVYSPTDVICSLISLIKNTKKKINLLLSWIIFNIVIILFNIIIYSLVGEYDIYSHIYGCIISTVVFLLLYLVKVKNKDINAISLPATNNLNEFEESASKDLDNTEDCWFKVDTFTSSDDEEEY